MILKTAVFTLCASAAFCILVNCRMSHESRKPLRVRLAVVSAPTLVQLPILLAQQLGHFNEEGLQVTVEDLASGPRVMQALLGGSADTGSGFCEMLFQLAANGQEFKAFTLMLNSSMQALAVSPKAGVRIRTIHDLGGATVGVTGTGSGAHMHVRYLLARNGVSVDIVPVGIAGNAARVAALEAGKVDAAILGEPGLSLLIKRHPGVILLGDTRTAEGVHAFFGSDTYPGTALFATSRWLRDNPDTARRLARAIRRTLRWMQDRTPEQIADRVPAAIKGNEPGLYVQALRVALPMYSRDGVMSHDGMSAVQRVVALSDRTGRVAGLDLSKLYTNEFGK
jgi:NitT/TauT family transport system substrate-binding protein